MSTFENVVKWAETLGYQGTIPDAFKSICNNPSTLIIWQQLLTQVQPKQDVQKIRYNNLCVRLRMQNEPQISNSAYPMRELELYERKCKLQREINEIKEYIAEKECLAKNYSNEHKIIAMKRRNLQDRIKENRLKSFLLKRKTEAFQQEIAEMEDNVVFFQNLTPTESTEDELDVANRLKRCVEKIESSLLKDEIKAPACIKNNLLLTPQKSCSTSIFAVSDFSLSDYSHCQEYKKEIAVEVKCMENEELSKDIKEILYKTDSQTIFNAIINDVDGLKTKLSQVIMNRNIYEKPSQNVNLAQTMSQLCAKQIENELNALKNMREIKKLRFQIKNKQNNIETIFKQTNLPRPQIQELQDLHLLLCEEAGLVAMCDCVGQQINECRNVKDAKKVLRDINSNIMKLQQNLVDNLRNINHKFELYKKIYKTMLSYRDETKLLVRKLSQFSEDLSWTFPLTNKLHSKEIETFKEFPLEYNRRINANGKSLYARDIMENISADVEKINADTLHTILSLIDCPYSAPETLFYDLWQRKMKLKAQKSLQRTIKSLDCKTFTMEDLEKQESFVDYAIARFNDLRQRESSKSLTQELNRTRDIAKLWLELPLCEYVCQNRLYEGKNLAYYQNMYDNLYNLIKKS